MIRSIEQLLRAQSTPWGIGKKEKKEKKQKYAYSSKILTIGLKKKFCHILLAQNYNIQYNIFIKNEQNLNLEVLKYKISTFEWLLYFLNLCKFCNFYIYIKNYKIEL